MCWGDGIMAIQCIKEDRHRTGGYGLEHGA